MNKQIDRLNEVCLNLEFYVININIETKRVIIEEMIINWYLKVKDDHIKLNEINVNVNDHNK